MGLHCEKGFVLTCKKPIVEQCAYCSQHFCIKHGHIDKATCKSRRCMTKYRREKRLFDRQTWEDERYQLGVERNAVSLCAYPECANEVYVACGHCETFYCPNHVARYNYNYRTHTRRAITRVKGDVTLCDVCQPYLREYNQDRYE